MAASLPQIRLAEQRIVHTIGKVCCCYRQHKLYDLFFRKMFSQFLKLFVADGRGGARYPVGKANDCFVFFVEEFAAVIKHQCPNLVLSNANPLRRSGVSAGSILAAIDQRCS